MRTHLQTHKKSTFTLDKTWPCRFRCTLCMHIHTNAPCALSLRWFMSVRLRFAWFILLKLRCAPEGLHSPLHTHTHTLHGGLLVTKPWRKVCVCVCAHVLMWSWRFAVVHAMYFCFYCAYVCAHTLKYALKCSVRIINVWFSLSVHQILWCVLAYVFLCKSLVCMESMDVCETVRSQCTHAYASNNIPAQVRRCVCVCWPAFSMSV